MHRFNQLALAAVTAVSLFACGPDLATVENSADSDQGAAAVTTTPELIKVMNACKSGPCTVRVVNNATKRCLAFSSTKLVTETCSNSVDQLFVIAKAAQGFWSFNLEGIRHQSTGRCLTWAPGAPQLATCASSNALQAWTFMTGFHDEFVTLTATNASSAFRTRTDFQLTDPSSHVVATATAGRVLDVRQEWTFTAAR